MRYLAGCYLQRRRIKRRSPPPSKVSFYGMQKIQQRRLIVTKAFNFTGAAEEEILTPTEDEDDGKAEMVRGRQGRTAASDQVDKEYATEIEGTLCCRRKEAGERQTHTLLPI